MKHRLPDLYSDIDPMLLMNTSKTMLVWLLEFPHAEFWVNKDFLNNMILYVNFHSGSEGIEMYRYRPEHKAFAHIGVRSL